MSENKKTKGKLNFREFFKLQQNYVKAFSSIQTIE